ncbi:MAG TPA: cytidylate kinase-like family protein [Polyangiaceae bacterium]|nr:cytidylate kinase-like family protein [Polyangiaceae bacterium]
MQIICVSRGTYGGGRDLAERLATKLGYPCLAREDLTMAATKAGIPVGKLEMTVVRRRPFNEALAAERDRLIAFITAAILDKALQGGVVYHGRTGHLVLPNLEHILRIRAIMDTDARTELAMARMRIDRDKARRYIEDVDEDRRRWVRLLYNVDWEDPSLYDMVINFDRVSVDNAAAALVAVAQLPEFQRTPAAQRQIEDLMLAAKCRLAIGDDPRMRHIDVKVHADRAKVTVTYPPRHHAAAEVISEVMARVPGVEESTYTMAATNILWIQEKYDAQSPVLSQMVEVAQKWNAAVQLMRLVAAPEQEGLASLPEEDEARPSRALMTTEDNAGILDDEADDEVGDDGGTGDTLDRLIQEGCAGGITTVRGGSKELLRGMDRTAAVSLVVVGDVFLAKGESVRKRETRELTAHLGESLRIPVIGQDELKEHYLFGAGQWLKMAVFLAMTVVLFVLVFMNQETISWFLVKEGTQHRILAAAVLAIFVPGFAYVWGGATQYLLRLAKFE